MKYFSKTGFLLSFIVVLVFVAPLTSHAGIFDSMVGVTQTTSRTVSGDSVVPCGTGTTMCTFEDFVNLAKRIIDISLVYIVIPLAVLSFAAAGFRYLLAFGNESEASKVHSMVTSTVQGVFVAFFAWLVVSTLFSFFVQDAFNPFK